MSSSSQPMAAQRADFFAKIVIIGNSNIGKTHICYHLSNRKDQLDKNNGTTIGIDMFKMEYRSSKNQKVSIQLWDTAGQQHYRSITKSYFKGADLVVFTFSVVEQKSFDDLCKWAKLIQESVASRDIFVVFVGNKIDLVQNRNVEEKYQLSQEKIDKLKELSQKMNNKQLRYFLISAKTGENMDQFKIKLFEIALLSKKKVNAIGNRPIYLSSSGSGVTQANVQLKNKASSCC